MKNLSLGVLNLSRRGLNRDSPSTQIQKVGLDSRETLNSFKCYALMCQEILISISIGLDCRDPQA